MSPGAVLHPLEFSLCVALDPLPKSKVARLDASKNLEFLTGLRHEAGLVVVKESGEEHSAAAMGCMQNGGREGYNRVTTVVMEPMTTGLPCAKPIYKTSAARYEKQKHILKSL